MDANENIRDGPLQRELSSSLDMYDVVSNFSDSALVATYQRGSR